MRHIYQLPPHDFMKNFSWTKALVLFVRSQSHDARPDSGLRPKKDEWAEEAYSTARGRVNLYLSTSLVQKETTKDLSEMCEAFLGCTTKVLRSLLLSFVFSTGTDAEGFV